MLKSLTLENFKCHEQAHIDFDPHLTLITGGNYRGKTTVLHGILFALWGPAAVPGGKARIIRRGAKRCLVTLEWFTDSGNVLSIQRSMSTAKMQLDGEPIATSASAVGAELAERLGLDNKLFMRLKYGAQGEAQAMLTLGGPELHKTIERVCGVDTVTSMLELLRVRLSETKGALEAHGNVDIAPMTEQLTALRTELMDVRGQSTALDDQMPAARAGLGTAQSAERDALSYNAATTRKIDRAETLQTNIATTVRRQSNATQVRGQAAADLEVIRARYAPLSQDLVSLVEAAGQAQRRIGVLQDQVETQTSLHRTMNATQANLTRELRSLGITMDVDQAQETERVSQLGVLFERISQLDAAARDGVCPTCHRPFEGYDVQDHARRRAELTEHYEIQHKELDQLKAHNAYAEKHNANIAIRARDLEQTEGNLQGIRKQLGDWATQLVELRGRYEWPYIESLEIQMQDQKSKARELELSAQLLAQQDEALTAFDKSLFQDREELAEIQAQPLDLLDLGAFGTAREQWQTHVGTLQEHIAGLRSKADLLEERCKHLDSALRQLQQLQETIDKLHVERDRITRLGKYLKENRDRFLGNVWERVLGLAGAFASGATEGYIEGLTRTDAGQFNYLEGGEACTVSEASGAQKSLLGVGLQIAMSQMLPSPWHTLMLDEPTANMDEEHALACTALLAASNNQLVVVSHRTLDAAVAGKVVEL